MPRNIKTGLSEIADSIIRDVRANWTPESPSVRGQPPAVVTGRLDRSLKNTSSNRDFAGRFISRMGGKYYRLIEVEAPYSGVLENPAGLNRPFLAPAVERAQDRFPGLMAKVIFK